MSATTKLSSKGQVVLPKPVRDALGWDEGTPLTITVEGDELRLSRTEVPRTMSIDDLQRLVGYAGPPRSDEDIRQAIVDGAATRFKRSSE
jgi:AbrB family looped-hinge helix DNA binding protein